MATRIVFITGVSGVGKTTLSAELAGREGVNAFDVDTHATERPNVAHLDWLRWRHAEYLHQATEGMEATTMVVSGICLPHWVIESNAWRPAVKAKLEVDFIMLKPPWEVTKARIEARVPDDKRERKALVAYNKGLQKKIEDQVLAYTRGGIFFTGDVTPIADAIVEGMF